MSWIKRNLYFLIGGVIALVLLGGAGWYLYSKWDLNNTNFASLNQAYTDLKGLNDNNPNPGGENIKIAKEQRKDLLDYMNRARKYFQKIPQIPDLPKKTDRDFAFALSRTIDQLRRDLTNASVNLQDNYNFSFQAEKLKISFAPGSLEPLSTQLGEVKAICDVLFQARINALDSLRRERVSTDDTSGPATDYVGENSTTNALSVLTPYELTFRCFSPELATVLAGFASSPYGFIVKTINVEVAGTSSESAWTPQPPPTPAPVRAGFGISPYGFIVKTINVEVAGTVPESTWTPQPQPTPAYVPPPQPVQPVMTPEQAEIARYGGPDPSRFRRPYGEGTKLPTYPQPQYVAPVAAPAAARGGGGLPVVVDEKQLKVTMQLEPHIAVADR